MGGPLPGFTPNDRGTAIITDATGNVYTTGAFVGTVDFDPGSGVFNMTAIDGSLNSVDFFIQKLDAQGNFIWAKQIMGSGAAGGYGIKLDNAGNILITGYYWGTKDFNPGSGVYSLTSAGMADIFILKLDANGNFLWAKAMGSSEAEGGIGVALDNENHIYVTGRFLLTVDFDPGAGIFNLSSAGSYDVFVLKLDPDGNFIWAKRAGGTGAEYGNAIAIDENGVYVAGSFVGTADFDPGTSSFNLTAAGTDIYIWKLTFSGDLVWVKQMIGNLSSYGSGIAIHSGNIYYTGWFWGTVDFDPGAGSNSLTSLNNNRDIIISKLNSSGELLWAKQFGGNNDDEGNAITVDNDGNIYTTGYFSLTVDFNPGAGVNNLIAADDDIFIVKLDPSGNYFWAGDMGGSGQDIGFAISVSTNAIHTTGSFQNNADFDPGPNGFGLTSNGHNDIFIQKLIQTTTATVDFDPDIESTILSPNPVNEQAILTTLAKKSMLIQWAIVDLNGKVLLSFQQQLIRGRNDKRISLHNLPAGQYYLKGQTKNNKQTVVSFRKLP